MSAPQFTPGPWDAGWWAAVLRDLHNFLPDGLRGPADEDDPWGTKGEFNYPGLTGHDEPNANLIAAAPELYEALEELLGSAFDGPAYDRAVAALAKARGEQP